MRVARQHRRSHSAGHPSPARDLPQDRKRQARQVHLQAQEAPTSRRPGGHPPPGACRAFRAPAPLPRVGKPQAAPPGGGPAAPPSRPPAGEPPSAQATHQANGPGDSPGRTPLARPATGRPATRPSAESSSHPLPELWPLGRTPPPGGDPLSVPAEAWGAPASHLTSAQGSCHSPCHPACRPHRRPGNPQARFRPLRLPAVPPGACGPIERDPCRRPPAPSCRTRAAWRPAACASPTRGRADRPARPPAVTWQQPDPVGAGVAARASQRVSTQRYASLPRSHRRLGGLSRPRAWPKAQEQVCHTSPVLAVLTQHSPILATC